MKTKYLAIAAALMSLSFTAFAIFGSGWGNTGTATTTVQQVTGFTVNTLSVYNQGAATFFCNVSCASNVFAANLTSGTSVPIPANSSFTFNAQAHASIDTISFATTNGTAIFYLAGY